MGCFFFFVVGYHDHGLKLMKQVDGRISSSSSRIFFPFKNH